eukprot:m.697522 g.697522  ORF g.697522 m.697522 type:complete len:234 (+) comp22897_c0_seq30:327-1028(+)
MPRKKKKLRTQVQLASTACAPETCTCTVNDQTVDDALLRTLQHPAYAKNNSSADLIFVPSRGAFNRKDVLWYICRDYLSHSSLSSDLPPKQVRLRQALRRVGQRKPTNWAGWQYISEFNTKTTSFRTLGKALWDGCCLPPPTAKVAREVLDEQKAHKEAWTALLKSPDLTASICASSCTKELENAASDVQAAMDHLNIKSSAAATLHGTPLRVFGVRMFLMYVAMDAWESTVL